MLYITLKVPKKDARLVNARQEMYDTLCECVSTFAVLSGQGSKLAERTMDRCLNALQLAEDGKSTKRVSITVTL